MDKKTQCEEEVKKLNINSLKEILFNRQLHSGWMITAARKELENRGIQLTNEELEKIESKKKQRIEDAKKNTIQNSDDPFFIFDNFILSQIKLNFENVGYFKRIRKNVLIGFSVGLVLGIVIGLLKFQKFGIEEVLGIIAASLLFALTAFLTSIIENRFYVINLKADKKSIEIEYLNFNRTEYYQSSIQEVEIIEKRSFEKSPKPVLVIKNNQRRILRIYTFVHPELDEDRMILLINNLRKLKNA